MYPATCDIFNCFGAINVTLVFLLTTGLVLSSPAAQEISSTLESPETQYDFGDETILTPKERIALQKLKLAVLPNISQEYLGHDLFLLRWLREKNLSVRNSVKDMIELLAFYERNKLDKILNEDFSDLAEEFPSDISAVDREGRPVIYIPVTGTGWKIRKALREGKKDRVVRYSYRLMVEMMMKVFEINKSQHNVTQFVVLVNLDGFQVFQHSCASCVRSYLNLYDTFKRYVPEQFVKEIIVFNAPEAYRILLQMLRPSLSPYMRNAFTVFGRRKSEWKKYLDTKIDTSRLSWDL